MRNSLPTSNLVLGYHDILGSTPPEDRLTLIRNISKNSLILEIAALNFRLKGKFSKEIDSKLSTQQMELFYFCAKNKALYNRYAAAANKFTNGKKTNLFSRPACTFAIEEILSSELPEIPGYKLSTLTEWESILKYLLAVNEHITKYERTNLGETVNFESLNPKLLPLSETLLVSDPLYNLHRGISLLDYLSNHSETGQFIQDYFKEVYSTTYQIFILEIYRMYFANEHKNKAMNFYYMVPESDPFKYFFEIFSTRSFSDDPIKLIGLKKSPFYKNHLGHYVLSDNMLLLDKSYQQLINDFWFDFLKNKTSTSGKDLKFQDYKSLIGRFFENYTDQLLKFSFGKHQNYILKTLDQLKVKVKKQESDTADFYIRNFKKVIVGEIKSTSIYDKEKFGRTMGALYKNDRNEFFNRFGVNQLVNYIKNLKHDLKDIDPGLSELKKVRIWPVILFNEKAFQTPMMAPVFNKRFKELFGENNDKSIYVYPLTIIHISDLEQMSHVLSKNPDRIWYLLTNNFWKSKFLPPFYITLNRNHIRYKYEIVKKRLFQNQKS